MNDCLFDVQGHRGARGLRPENTLAAFEYAIALGVTTLEMDTGISKDGVVVVCHDSFINPLLCLDSKGDRLPLSPQRLIKDLSVAEIQAFDCGSLNPDPVRFPHQQAVPGARIPTLQQVFDLAEARNSQIRYNIESKVNPLKPNETASPAVFAEKLVDLIVQNNLVERATIQSFDWRVLREARRLQPAIQTSALVVHSHTTSTLKGAKGASPFLAGLDFESCGGNMAALLQSTGFVDIYSPNFETLLPESPTFLQAVSEVQAAGFKVIPWTVNEPAIMQQFIHLNVDGLITDFPNVLLDMIQQGG
ncbi:glycerophosphodiester phosphodiesterase [Leptothermofonsia sp. ETS-13]|uniref:glycerophosphodiester phosphodiesterase n=1 Tax=Leptothermofonsia sp. ETS-13 TaxID=3035696 RepID=UPI003BA34641